MLEHYTIVNVQDARKDEEAILETLASVKGGKSGSRVTLLNYHKEVPIRFEATIEHVERGAVEVSVHGVQAAVISLQKATLILCDRLPHPVVAKVLRLNSTTRLAFLGHLAYAAIPSERRKFVRVKVMDRHAASFTSNEKTVSGSVLDLSIGGVSVLAREEIPFGDCAPGTVRIDLDSSPLSAECKLLRTGHHNGLFKYVLELQAVNPKSELRISHFINLQQGEIVRELKEIMLRW